VGKRSRTKGAQYEREVAKKITAALGVEFKRRLGQAREGGHDLTSRTPLITECKRRAKSIAALQWLEQAKASCTSDDHIPIVVTRGDNSEDVLVMYFDEFLPIFLKAWKWDLIHEGE
jgi:hypothetical protein